MYKCINGPAVISFAWKKDINYGSAFELSFCIINSRNETIYNINCPSLNVLNNGTGFIPDHNTYRIVWEYKIKTHFRRLNDVTSRAQIREVSFGKGIEVQCGPSSPPNFMNNTTYVDRYNSDPSKYKFNSVEEAIKHVNPSGTVYIYPAFEPYFIESSLYINKTINLTGVGKIRPLIELQKDHNDKPLIYITANEVQVRNLKLVGGKSGIYILSALDNILNNILISNCKYGIYLDSGDYSTVADNTIENYGVSGIFLNNATYCTISNNTILKGLDMEYASGISMKRTRNNLVDKNDIQNTGVGIRLYDQCEWDNITKLNKFYGIKYFHMLAMNCNLSRLEYPNKWIVSAQNQSDVFSINCSGDV